MVRANSHIDTDSLVRNNRKWLRLCAYVPARPPLRDENIIAWRQHSAIISVRVRSNPRDFFLSVPAQDEQWIISIVCRRDRRRVFIADVDRLGRKDLQMSLHDARRQSITRCSVAGAHQKDAPDNQVFEKHSLPHKKMGGIDFTYPAHFTKPPLRQAQRPSASSMRRCVKHSSTDTEVDGQSVGRHSRQTGASRAPIRGGETSGHEHPEVG